MTKPRLTSVAGAVDLSTLASSSTNQSAGASSKNSSWIIDATDSNFQTEVLDRSLNAPVVVDLWAQWCEPCKQLSPLLERLAEEGKGSWYLAKVDVDANPIVSSAFRVKSIPAVIAVWQGKPVSAFQGLQPASAIENWLASLLSEAGVEVTETEADIDPRVLAAQTAMDQHDYAGAAEKLTDYLAENPNDTQVKIQLAHVNFLARTIHLDSSVLTKAQANPAGTSEVSQAADYLIAQGSVDEGFEIIIKAISLGGDKARLRSHLVTLFELFDPDDQRVLQARTKLANALF